MEKMSVSQTESGFCGPGEWDWWGEEEREQEGNEGVLE